MGLFGKKVDVIIAFVGKYTQRVSPIQEQAIMNTYKARLQSLVHHNYPGVNRYRVWYFRNWTDDIYSAATLNSVAENGFSAYDSGEKKNLFDAIEKALILKYSVMKSDYHPTVILESIEPYSGVFVILCKVSVNEKKL